MPIIKYLNIPGKESKVKSDFKLHDTSMSKDVLLFFKENVIPQVTDSFDVDNILSDFDTTYLRNASEQGSEANKFFIDNISPILIDLGKEDNPSELLKGLTDLKDNPDSFRTIGDTITLGKDFDSSSVDTKISNIASELENSGSFVRDFGGSKSRLSGIKRSILDSEVDFLNNLYNTDPDKLPEIPNIINDIFNDVSNPKKQDTVTYPVAITISGLKGLKGEDLGNVRYAFPLFLPIDEDFLEIGEDGEFNVSEEGVENIRSLYLSPSRIKKNTRLSAKASDKKDLWKETLSLIIKIADKQKEEGNDVNYSISAYPKYFNKKQREYEEEGLTNFLKNTSMLELIRRINNTDHNDYKSLNNIANNNRISTPLRYVQKLYKSDKELEDTPKTGKNLKNIEVSIPYDKINSEFHISNKDSLPSVFDVYQKQYSKGKRDNPIGGRELQKYLNSQLSEEEIESVKYIDRNLYDGFVESDPEAIKQFFVSDENGSLTLMEPYLEHISPISDLSNVLWEDIFLKMKEEGYGDEEIKKRIEDIIKLLYGEAYIQASVDSYKLTLQLANTTKLSEDDKEALRKGQMDPSMRWRRYKRAGHPIPISLSDMKKDFPNKIPNVTYSDIRKDLYENKMIDSKYSIMSLLYESVYDDGNVKRSEDVKNNLTVNYIVRPKRGNYYREVLSEDDFEEVLEELQENDTPILRINLRLNNNSIRKNASKIAKKHSKIKIGNKQYILNTKLSDKDRLIWTKKNLWWPKSAPKPAPKGLDFPKFENKYNNHNMINEVEYKDIYSDEALESIRKKSEEILDKRLKGKSVSTAMMDAGRIIMPILMAERQNKDYLEALAVDIVENMYPTLFKIAPLEIDAKIVQPGSPEMSISADSGQEELSSDNVDIDSIDLPGEKKRRVIRSITQGASIYGSESYKLFNDIIDQLDPKLVEMYNSIIDDSYGIYFQEKLKSLIDSIKGGSSNQGGEAEVFTEEDPNGDNTYTIKARAIIFPILVQEIIKGVYEFLSFFGMGDDPEAAQAVADKDKTEYEPEDIRNGTILYDFVKDFLIDNNIIDIEDSKTSTEDKIATFFREVMYSMEEDEMIKLADDIISGKVSSTDVTKLLKLSKDIY